MPERKTPTYRYHKARDLAVVTIYGKDHYLGPYDSTESRDRYDALIRAWREQQSFQSVIAGKTKTFLVAHVIQLYIEFADGHYRKDGKPTSQIFLVRVAAFWLARCARLDAAKFGSRRLMELRDQMVKDGLSRNYINRIVSLIKRMFKVAAIHEQIPAEIYNNLRLVEGLEKGRTAAPELDPVEPVPEEDYEKTLPFLPPIVRDMAKVQHRTGARPGEVCLMRPCDIKEADGCWLYTPQSHKNEHKSKRRIIVIGPQAMETLRPYLKRSPNRYCFSPKEAEQRRRKDRHAARTTPSGQGNKPGTNKKKKPKRTPGERYTNASYRRAVHRACKTAEVKQWSPNQLRHNLGTRIRAANGIEASQVILGHSSIKTTELYAERDLKRAMEVIRELG